MTEIIPGPLLYPVGHHASGKTELSQYLINQHGFGVVETGAMVRSEYADRIHAQKGMNIGHFVTDMERRFPNYFTDLTLTKVEQEMTLNGPKNGVIINGMRTLKDLKMLQEKTSAHPAAILWVDSPYAELKKRWEAREGRSLIDEEFTSLLAFDSELGLDEIRDMANVHIVNDGSIEMLNIRVEIALRDMGLIALNDYAGEIVA